MPNSSTRNSICSNSRGQSPDGQPATIHTTPIPAQQASKEESLTQPASQSWLSKIKSTIRGTVEAGKNEIHQLSDQHDLSMKDLKKEHERKVKKLETDFRKETELRRQADENIRVLKEALQKSKQSAGEDKDQYDLDIEDLKSQHRLHLVNLNKDHEQECNHIKSGWQTKYNVMDDNWKTKFERETTELALLRKTNLRQLEEKNEQIKLIRSKTDERVQAAHEQLTQLKETHQTEMSELRQALEEKKAALIRRNIFHGLNDSEVSGTFQKICTQLDRISRVRWDESKKETWPCASFNLGWEGGRRKLKQNVILSSMWVILFDNIFCGPFQIFGNKGDILHNKWAKQFGMDSSSKDFSFWPKPTKESEQWRYSEICRCVAALRKGQSAGELAWEFDVTIKDVSSVITQSLGVVASDADIKALPIPEMVKEAAHFWLELCSQHCRFMIVVSQAAENLLGKRDEGTNPLLVLEPRIERYGDAQGEQLEVVEVLRNCGGEETLLDTW